MTYDQVLQSFQNKSDEKMRRDPVSKDSTSPFDPVWIKEMVPRKDAASHALEV
jgi:hypothetical protein